ncbi:HNH endonuclease [Spirosoma litoris]
MSQQPNRQPGLIAIIRRLDEYEEWKRAVFIRDRFTCQHCGARNGRKRVIEADHIKSLSELVSKYGIVCIETALKCPALWDITNGRTLCHSCHEKTESYPVNFRGKVKGKKKAKV